jgi:hypothetical protein
MGIYLMYNPNWFPLEMTMTTLSCAANLFIMIFMPESPKWCLIKGDKESALNAFDTIARVNRSKNLIPRNADFVELIIAKNTDQHREQNESAVNMSLMGSVLDLSIKATRIHKIKGYGPAISKKGRF